MGVVGTDVFDKIVILQALKRVLPEAHFFTTDLDALFTYKPYKGFTQNLLVASSYGFRLTPPCQGRAPPFRDSYQTTIYASLLGALNYYDFSRGLFPDTPNPLRAFDDIPLSPVRILRRKDSLASFVRGVRVPQESSVSSDYSSF